MGKKQLGVKRKIVDGDGKKIDKVLSEAIKQTVDFVNAGGMDRDGVKCTASVSGRDK